MFANQDTNPGGDINLNSNGTPLGGLFIETYDNGNRYLPMYRRFDDIQNDFAARMEWCYKSYQDDDDLPIARYQRVIVTVEAPPAPAAEQ